MFVSLLGYGTVGRGVWDMMQKASFITPCKVLEKKDRCCEPFMTDDIESIVSDKQTEVVVECMGGVDFAYSCVKKALENGKDVVTSNKALVVAHGLELNRIASERGVSFVFSAACGGSMPILRNLESAKQTDTVLSCGGILNGTTNYILTRMQKDGLSYDSALKEAQEKGYAEQDPSADLSGADTLRKIILMSAVSFDMMPEKSLLCEGIDNINEESIDDLKEMNRTVKLYGNSVRCNGTVSAYVLPVAFKNCDIESLVDYNMNLARYEAECAGIQVFMGQGAGRYPTASAVLRDLTLLKDRKVRMISQSCAAVESSFGSVRADFYLNVNGKANFAHDVAFDEIFEKVKNLRKEGSKVFFAQLV